MTLTFPLSQAAFFAGLKVKSCTFDLPDASVDSGRTGAGELLTADVGARLWTGTVELSRMSFDDAHAAKALISTLRRAGRSFFVHCVEKPGPRSDPKGLLIAGSTPQIKSIAANNRELTLKAMPAAYVLATGDYLGFSYGSNPTRYAFHQVAVGGTVVGGEVSLELTDFIRNGAAANAAVTLFKPYCKAQIVPGTVSPGTAQGSFITGISFSWRQTLR